MSSEKVDIFCPSNDLNLNEICRVCLEQKHSLYPLTSNLIFEKENVIICMSIASTITYITSQPVNIEDTLPKNICLDCTSSLRIAYLFRRKYEESAAILKNCISETGELIHALRGQSDAVDNQNLQSKIEETDSNVKFQKILPQPLSKQKNMKGALNNGNTISKIRSNNKPDQTELNGVDSLLHPCPICPLEFTALDLRRHIHTHKALKRYLNINQRCKLNTKFYATPRFGVSFFKQKQILHTCPFCNKYIFVDAFRRHVENHKKNEEFKCDKCDRVFRKVNHLTYHKTKHMKEFPYVCKQCDKGFLIKTNYDCHVLTHTSAELPHQCEFCLKRFSNPRHLTRHVIIHTENISYATKYKPSKRRFKMPTTTKCHICKKIFTDRLKLRNHMSIKHPGEAKFACETCTKVFRYPESLYRHKMNVHKQRNVKALCSICGRYVSNIYVHTLNHSGEKPFPCNQCQKRFATSRQLKRHMSIHSDLKPYICSGCGKAFHGKYNLQAHEKTHRTDKCHICPVCNKGFYLKSYLCRHMNKHKDNK